MSSPYQSQSGKAVLVLALGLLVVGLFAFGFGTPGFFFVGLASIVVTFSLAIVQ